jgi:hypothetical protein
MRPQPRPAPVFNVNINVPTTVLANATAVRRAFFKRQVESWDAASFVYGNQGQIAYELAMNTAIWGGRSFPHSAIQVDNTFSIGGNDVAVQLYFTETIDEQTGEILTPEDLQDLYEQAVRDGVITGLGDLFPLITSSIMSPASTLSVNLIPFFLLTLF